MTFPLILPSWSWRPNWRESVNADFEFDTEIIVSRSGEEKRQANRQNPRRSLSFLITRQGEDAQAFTRFISKNANKEIAMPDYPRAVEVPETVVEGQDTFELASIPYWLVEGEPVYLADRENQAFLTVDDITGLQVTLSAALPFDLNAGRGKLIPPVRGLIAQPLASAIRTDKVLESQVVLNITPTSEPERDYAFAGDLLNGREIFDFNPNFASGFNRETQKPLDIIDFGRGKIEWIEAVQFLAATRQVDFLLDGQAEIDRFLGYFYRARGMQDEMYVPTWEDDIPLAVNALSGATTINSPGTAIYEAHAADTTRRAIEVRLWDGRVFRRRVSAISSVSGNSRLTLTSGLPYDLEVSNVKRLSWLQCSRFASDNLTLVYQTDQKATVRTAFASLPDHAPE